MPSSRSSRYERRALMQLPAEQAAVTVIEVGDDDIEALAGKPCRDRVRRAPDPGTVVVHDDDRPRPGSVSRPVDRCRDRVVDLVIYPYTALSRSSRYR